jgi:hypothetical protein
MYHSGLSLFRDRRKIPEQRPAGSPVKFVENLFRCVDERFDYLDDVLWSTKRDQKIVVKGEDRVQRLGDEIGVRYEIDSMRTLNGEQGPRQLQMEHT